jgi:hypothetical protein
MQTLDAGVTPTLSIFLTLLSMRSNLIPETEMNRYFRNLLTTLSLAALVLPLAAASLPPAKQQAFVGEITDSMCEPNGSHTQMMNGVSSMGHDKETCTRECVRLGAAYVLYDPVTQTVYHFDDPAKAEPFAGRKVHITGTLEVKNINIAAIEAAS